LNVVGVNNGDNVRFKLFARDDEFFAACLPDWKRAGRVSSTLVVHETADCGETDKD
jgi:hypothetical protein